MLGSEQAFIVCWLLLLVTSIHCPIGKPVNTSAGQGTEAEKQLLFLIISIFISTTVTMSWYRESLFYFWWDFPRHSILPGYHSVFHWLLFKTLFVNDNVLVSSQSYSYSGKLSCQLKSLRAAFFCNPGWPELYMWGPFSLLVCSPLSLFCRVPWIHGRMSTFSPPCS